ncbi:MAG: Gfo/Idh/MocA family oxidoreductase, partial [Oscillospiraceae bacterium]|nr:Gfo/Idh/MocA family oxidoreductase [Oscillospiraceae bacterium]
MDKIRWGIIGTGKIANTFAQGLCNVEDAVLEAVASRDIQKANLFADKYGFEKAYGSYAELAADND